jgi:hypothetical protein
MFQSEIALGRVGVEMFSLYHTHVRTKGDRIMQRFFSTLPYLTLQQLGSIACAALLLVACGSKGGGGGGGGTPPAATPQAGVFIDSPIAGLGYNAAPSGLSGLTSATGQFNYNPGDNLTFNIGGRAVGNSVPGAPVITGLMVFGATSLTDVSVVNLAQLLLTLGGVPAGQNPIQLPAAVPAALPNSLNFSDPNFDANLLAAGITLVPEPVANTHLQGQFSTVFVTFAGAGSGTVTSNPSGINCSSGTCSNVFINGDSVTLTATGSGFAGWSFGTGNAASCTGIGPCAFTVTGDSSITATFNVPPPPTLIILPNQGSGTGSVTCNGVACAATYASGTQIVLQAAPTAGSTFTSWINGLGNAANCKTNFLCPITLNTDTSVRANFVLNAQTTFSLTTTTQSAPGNGGNGLITCAVNAANGGSFSPCAPSYPAGTDLTLKADPASGSNFTGWSGACSSSGTGLCNFLPFAADATVIANFNRPTLTVHLSGSGTVTSDVGGINCAPTCSAAIAKDTVVTLTASGAGFTSWSGCTAVINTPTQCTVTVTVDTLVTATFGTPTGSLVPNFKFISAPGQQLLAIDPRSPASPTPVKVNNAPVTFPAGTRDFGSTIASGTYNPGTTSFEHIVANTILFPFQGKLYRASTKILDGVPGNGGIEPVQVSNYSDSTTLMCGAGSILAPTDTNPIVGFNNAGANGTCNDADDFIVLMHLQDSFTTAATALPIGTSIEGDTAVYNLANGSLDHVMVVKGTGDLQWIGDNMIPTDIPGGTGIGIGTSVTIVARQADKVFLANNKNLYIYNPLAHTLNATPVVSADPGETWVLNQNRSNEPKIPADGTAIYPVVTNGKVFKVLLTTATATTHFIPPPTVTKAADVEQTANRIIIHTGTRSFGNNGVADPCVAANTCNNGIIAVNKASSGGFVTIEPAVPTQQIYNLMSFNNHVLYGLNNPGISGGAFARDVEASPLPPRIDRQGNWTQGILKDAFNVVSNQQTVIRGILVDPPTSCTQGGCVVDGTPVRAFDLPTTPTSSARLLGTVSDPSSSLQFTPFFRRSINNAMIGTANLKANPLHNQQFFVDTLVPSSLKKIPTAEANWQDINSNLE